MFLLHTGIRQGDPLYAYLLYDAYTDELVGQTRHVVIECFIRCIALLLVLHSFNSFLLMSLSLALASQLHMGKLF